MRVVLVALGYQLTRLAQRLVGRRLYRLVAVLRDLVRLAGPSLVAKKRHFQKYCIRQPLAVAFAQVTVWLAIVLIALA